MNTRIDEKFATLVPLFDEYDSTCKTFAEAIARCRCELERYKKTVDVLNRRAEQGKDITHQVFELRESFIGVNPNFEKLGQVVANFAPLQQRIANEFSRIL